MEKGSIEWKKKKYIQMGRILDRINEQSNFCNIRKEKGKITCNGVFKDRETLCCNKCSHLTESGCNTNSLYCKISYCYIGTGPIDCGLVNQNNRKLLSRRKFIVNLILKFASVKEIPIFKLRISMEDAFAIHTEERDEKDFDMWEGKFFEKE